MTQTEALSQDEIIEMARESGFLVAYVEQGSYYIIQPHGKSCVVELRNFAKLVAAKERDAIIDLVAMYGGPVDLEAAIRARGEA